MGGIDGGEAWRRRENLSPKWQLGHAIRSDNESTESEGFRAQHSGWPYSGEDPQPREGEWKRGSNQGKMTRSEEITRTNSRRLNGERR